MFAKELPKAMELLGPYGVDSFESSPVDNTQHYLEVRFLDGSQLVFKRLSEVQSWVDDQVLESTIFATIARINFRIESLDVQNRDSLDFHEVHVLDIKKALRDAFQAGARSVKSTK
jgi:hypothetical protein